MTLRLKNSVQIFLWIDKIPLIFKEAEMLPRRRPNFGKGDNFVYLSIYVYYWIFGSENYFHLLRPTPKFGTWIFFPKILTTKFLKELKFALARSGPT